MHADADHCLKQVRQQTNPVGPSLYSHTDRNQLDSVWNWRRRKGAKTDDVDLCQLYYSGNILVLTRQQRPQELHSVYHWMDGQAAVCGTCWHTGKNRWYLPGVYLLRPHR